MTVTNIAVTINCYNVLLNDRELTSDARVDQLTSTIDRNVL